MNNYKLTVIVPCFNVEKYLRKTLDSLIAQTSKEFKVLLIDDGSTDSTLSIIKEYVLKNSNFSYITKNNEGIAKTRNIGLDNIDTSYFGFLDSDDYIESDMISQMLAKIESDNSDMCVCNFIWQWDKKQKFQKEGPYYTSSEMIVKQISTLWNKIYRTSLLEKYKLNFPNGYRYEDTYFLYCLAANPLKISFIDNYFVYYVQREGSITHTNNEKVHDMIVVLNKIVDYYYENELYEKFYYELEFLFAKFLLGNSFLRACQIDDKNTRNKILQISWDNLIKKYPDFKRNPFLKTFSLPKRIYYQLINKRNYKIIGNLIHLAYSVKKR